MSRSVRQTPARSLRTSTSSGPHIGVSTSRYDTSCGRSITTAFTGLVYSGRCSLFWRSRALPGAADLSLRGLTLVLARLPPPLPRRWKLDLESADSRPLGLHYQEPQPVVLDLVP